MEGAALPKWYFSTLERIEALQSELRQAQADLERATEDLREVESQSTSSEFLAAEKDLAQAMEAFHVAEEVLDRATRSVEGEELQAEAQRILEQAQKDLEDAREKYDRALRTDGAQDVLEARVRVEVAQERVDTILDQIRMLQTGELSPQVMAAQDAVDQAEAAVQGARANLGLLDAQIAKAIVTAPADGVVLTRAVEPGSVVGAGSVVFTMADLERLTITVYVPEDRIGEVFLGMDAVIAVDSYPGVTFRATVTYIADYAEFTPRNVQTVEGRRTTVFSVKLTLIDGTGDLKPGMPADVSFGK
jgi:HlyD family secretion protein